jgi:hypothetical protein
VTARFIGEAIGELMAVEQDVKASSDLRQVCKPLIAKHIDELMGHLRTAYPNNDDFHNAVLEHVDHVANERCDAIQDGKL